MNEIYLDNNATTPLAAEAREAMLPFLAEHFGNPSSVHRLGQRTAYALSQAREQVAALIGARPREVVFTSGGTESIHLAVRGTLAMNPDKRHLITTAVEHEAVLGLTRQLEADGYQVTYIAVNELGHLDLDELAGAIRDDTALIAVMWANNETGVIFPVEQIGRIAAERGVPFFVDAVQDPGKLPIDVEKLPVQMLSLSAHKLHGPKGVGALYLRRGTHLRPVQVGGHQERGLRAGTENVPGIVGFGVAAELAAKHAPDYANRVGSLRDKLETALCERIAIARVNGDPTCRLPNTTNIGFERLEAEAVMLLLSENGIYASAGSACQSGSLEASHVLEAMGVPRAFAHGSVRFSLSRDTTEADIDAAIDRIPPLIARLTTLSRVTESPADRGT
jgi:cysteine desulfurase